MNPHIDDALDSTALHEQVRQRLSHHDQRYTSGRRALVDTLHGAGGPLTLPEILAVSPGLAQSSAYRNLDALERCGVIRRITATGDHAHYELAEPLLGHHHHLICVSCESIADVHLDHEAESVVLAHLHAAAATQGFDPVDHTLDLHGYCRSCRR